MSDNPAVLAECAACHGSVSTAAKSCPHCGHPLAAAKPPVAASDKGRVARVIGAAIAIFAIAALLSGTFNHWSRVPATLESQECNSQATTKGAIDAFNNGPAKVANVKILYLKDTREVSRSDDELKCSGSAVFNTTDDIGVDYRIFRRDDRFMIEIRLRS